MYARGRSRGGAKGYCKITRARLDCRRRFKAARRGGLTRGWGTTPRQKEPWRNGTVPVGTCPDCEAEVHVDLDADKGDTVTCDECSTELEIVGLDPVELDIAEEDLDDDLADDEDEY